MDSSRLHDARGIVLADLGTESTAVLQSIYTYHASGTIVFPLMVSPAPPVKSCGSVVVDFQTLTWFPKLDFSGKTHVEAAISHLKRAVDGHRVLILVDRIETLSAFEFQAGMVAIKKMFGAVFSSSVRMVLGFNGRGPWAAAPFYTAQCIEAGWFGRRALVGIVGDVPFRESNPWNAEILRRCFDPRGIDGSDPFVAGAIRGVSSRTPTIEMVLGGSTLIAATAGGLCDALISVAASVWDWNWADSLVAQAVFSGSDGSQVEKKVVFPISTASRGSPRYFSTVLDTVPEQLTAKTTSGKPIYFPRGSRLWWDGQFADADLIIDDSTADEDGYHFREPEAPSSTNPGLRCFTIDNREVIVPLYTLGFRTTLSVRLVGFGTAMGMTIVIGTIATSKTAVRDVEGVTPVFVRESFSEEQFRAGLEAASGANRLTSWGSGSLTVNLAPPFGTGPVPPMVRAHAQSLLSRVGGREKVYGVV